MAQTATLGGRLRFAQARFEIRYISQCVPISIGQVVVGPQARGAPPARHWPLATVGYQPHYKGYRTLHRVSLTPERVIAQPQAQSEVDKKVAALGLAGRLLEAARAHCPHRDDAMCGGP